MKKVAATSGKSRIFFVKPHTSHSFGLHGEAVQHPTKRRLQSKRAHLQLHLSINPLPLKRARNYPDI
jgi:hypothetical protein